MNNKKNKKIIIAILFFTFIFMGISYALLSENLTITGTINSTGTWNVGFSSFEFIPSDEDSTNQGIDINYKQSLPVEFSNTTASVSFDLYKPGDVVVYRAEIKNSGNISAKLSSIENSLTDSSYIERSIIFKDLFDNELSDPVNNLILEENESVFVVITYKYKEDSLLPEEAYSTNDSISFNFVQN